MESFPFSSSSSAVASSSSNSVAPQGKYDVFLSFRGEDTRHNFTSHLHAALSANKILTFIDNDLERGEEISPSLLKAINESKISVVILSQDYASSKWCLEELVKILECRRNNRHVVLPVFYQVDPSHVHNQTGCYKDVFARYEESSLVSMDKVRSWRAALKEVAHLSGWHLTINRPEAEIIKDIIGDILKKLNKMSAIYCYKGLVGIESRIQEIESLLYLESTDVIFVGIWGMGGLGKTTLARVIYDRISPEFESCCFLSNTREQLNRCTLAQLQDQIFSALLENESLSTRSTLNLRFSFIKDRLSRRKVLIVADDVDNSIKFQQLLLDGGQNLFGSGSRILVTSRDRQVLKNIVGDSIYEMEKLNDHEAIQLFSLNAFKQHFPPSNYVRQSKKVRNYANGNPLALTVLGSALFDRSAEDWKSMLKILGNIPNSEIHNVLRASYDALNSEEQRIFLDIACFFRGEGRDHVTQVWGGYYPSIQFSITCLIDRCLITISNSNKLEMHDLLQEMAQSIVVGESEKPENRSRLVNLQDVYYVLKENKGTEVTEGICLDMSEAKEMCLKRDAFVRMCRLRFLKIYYSSFHDQLYGKLQLRFDEPPSLPNELRYLHWTKFPMKSLPSNFSPENLVVLNLPYSKVKKLWTGIQNLSNLKELDLSGSFYLTRIPDLSKAINIEKINLRSCKSLEEVHSSTQYLNKLEFLDLNFCNDLRRLPRRFDSKVMKVLRINDCPRVQKGGRLDFQSNHQLEELELDCRAIKDVQSTILSTLISSTLHFLRLHSFGKLSSLPSNFSQLTSLEGLNLDNFSENESFPEILEPMDNLRSFSLRNCKNLKRLPNSICNLKSLRSLRLDGSAIKEIPSFIEHLHCLESLGLQDCKYLESLPSSIHNLLRLKVVNLNSCKSLHSLPELPPSLRALDANNCKSLETVSISFSKCRNLELLNFGNCLRLDVKTLGLEAQHYVAENRYGSFYLLYPGSEVPSWFSHQSTESSISLQFPSNWDQFGDIAHCVVFEFKKSKMDFYNYYFKANFTDGCAFDKLCQPFALLRTCILAETDHVAIWSRRLKRKVIESSFDFYFRNSDGMYEIDKHCKVKRCGVSLQRNSFWTRLLSLVESQEG